MPKIVVYLQKSFAYLVNFILLFATYFITAKVGLSLDAASGFATLVWAPTGISLATLVLFGNKLWPAIFLAAFLVNLTTGAPPLVAIGMGVGNTLEALIGSYFLKKFIKIETFLDNIKDVFYFVTFAAFFSTAISAAIGVASLYLGGLVEPSNIIHTWTSWWIGDMLGDLIIFPLLVTWNHFSFQIFRQRPVELLIFLLTAIYASLVIFFQVLADNFHIPPRVYLIFPVLLWASLRFEKKIVTATIAVTSILAIIATIQGISPFVTAQASLSDNLLNLQTFIAVMSIMILSLLAVVSERKKVAEALVLIAEEKEDARKNLAVTAEALRRSRETLEEKVKERTDELEKTKQKADERAKEAERLNKVMIGRELRILELKNKVKALGGKIDD